MAVTAHLLRRQVCQRCPRRDFFFHLQHNGIHGKRNWLRGRLDKRCQMWIRRAGRLWNTSSYTTDAGDCWQSNVNVERQNDFILVSKYQTQQTLIPPSPPFPVYSTPANKCSLTRQPQASGDGLGLALCLAGLASLAVFDLLHGSREIILLRGGPP